MKRPRNRSRSAANSILFTTTSKTHQRKKLQQFGGWTALGLLTLVAVGVFTHFAVEALLRQLFFDNPRFALKEIRVEGDKHNITRQQVINASHVFLGENFYRLDLPKIERDVERLPYVGHADVNRQPPDRLIITITERVPVARIMSLRTDLNMREFFYIDRDGIIIKPQANEPLRPVPEITGGRFVDLEPGQRLDQPEVTAALNLLKQFDASDLKAMIDIHHFDVSRPLSFSMITQDGTTVTFRLDHLEIQLERLEEILKYASTRSMQLATVDLTPELNVPATFRN